MKILSSRIIFDVVMLAFAGFGLAKSLALPKSGGISVIGPADFPAAVCAIGVICMLVILFQDARFALEGKSDRHLSQRQIIAVSSVAVLLAVYIATLSIFGFIISNTIFLFLAILACAYFLNPSEGARISRRNLINAAIISIVATLASYFVFSVGFGLIFP